MWARVSKSTQGAHSYRLASLRKYLARYLGTLVLRCSRVYHSAEELPTCLLR